VLESPLFWAQVAIVVMVILYGVWSACAIPTDRWGAVGRSRVGWIWLMIGFGPLGVLLFFGTVRKELLGTSVPSDVAPEPQPGGSSASVTDPD